MLKFNDIQIDTFFSFVTIDYERKLEISSFLIKNKENNDMNNGKSLTITLYKRNYRQNLDLFITSKQELMDTCFSKSPFWLETDKNDCFYGYFTNIREEIKNDFTCILTLTFKSLYPYPFIKNELPTTEIYGDELSNVYISFDDPSFIFGAFTNTVGGVYGINGTAINVAATDNTVLRLQIVSAANTAKYTNAGFLNSMNKTITTRLSGKNGDLDTNTEGVNHIYPDCYYYKRMSIQCSSLSNNGAFQFTNGYYFTVNKDNNYWGINK